MTIFAYIQYSTVFMLSEGRRGSKMSIFVHAQGIKTVHARGGGQKWQNYFNIVVECPLTNRGKGWF